MQQKNMFDDHFEVSDLPTKVTHLHNFIEGLANVQRMLSMYRMSTADLELFEMSEFIGDISGDIATLNDIVQNQIVVLESKYVKTVKSQQGK